MQAGQTGHTGFAYRLYRGALASGAWNLTGGNYFNAIEAYSSPYYVDQYRQQWRRDMIKPG
jgi:hypothetical protein